MQCNVVKCSGRWCNGVQCSCVVVVVVKCSGG